MTIQAILAEAKEKGSKKVSQDELKDFWGRQEDLSKFAVTQILEKRKQALSSEAKIVLG